MSKDNKLTAENLRNELWLTLQAIKSKELNPREANAINGGAREICRVQGLQLQVYKLTGKKPTAAETRGLLLA
jgi:hypothetical protein